jgi:hypothetical protein
MRKKVDIVKNAMSKHIIFHVFLRTIEIFSVNMALYEKDVFVQEFQLF